MILSIRSKAFRSSGSSIQGVVVELDRLVGRVQLVVGDVAGGDEVLAPCTWPRLELGEAHEDLHRLLPLLGLAEEIEHVVQQLVIVRLAVERLEVGGDRLLRVVELVLVDRRRSRSDSLNFSSASSAGARMQRALRLMTASKSPRVGVQLDERLQRRPVAGLNLQRLLEHVDRLGALTLLQLDVAEAEEDVDDLVVLLGVAVVDQDRLVDPERVVPLLEPVEQRRAVEQRRQVGRVEVVGLLVVLERLVGVAQLIGRLRQPVVEQRQLAVASCDPPCGPASRGSAPAAPTPRA